MGQVTKEDGKIVICEPYKLDGKSFGFGTIVPKDNSPPRQFISYWGKNSTLTLQIGVDDPNIAMFNLDMEQAENLIKMLQLAVDKLKTTGVFEYPTTDIPRDILAKPIVAQPAKIKQKPVAPIAKPLYSFLADEEESPFA